MNSIFVVGRNGIEVEVPDGIACREVRSRKAIALPDETAAIETALDSPIACAPLIELARGISQGLHLTGSPSLPSLRVCTRRESRKKTSSF